jgi:hypothetical protein
MVFPAQVHEHNQISVNGRKEKCRKNKEAERQLALSTFHSPLVINFLNYIRRNKTIRDRKREITSICT